MKNIYRPHWKRLKELYKLSSEIMCLIDENKGSLTKEDLVIILDNLKNTITTEVK